MPQIKQLIEALANYRAEAPLLNQYRTCHPEFDRARGAAIRRCNLEAYLRLFAARAPRLLIVGEAAGYRGCRFSGIPFTSEHTLASEALFKGEPFAPSSRRDRIWREASASIVWETFAQLEQPPLLWGTVPFHPHRAGEPLSNRAPTPTERRAGFEFFTMLRAIFPDANLIACGRIAEEALGNSGYAFAPIRHPSHGGKKDFQRGVFNAAGVLKVLQS